MAFQFGLRSNVIWPTLQSLAGAGILALIFAGTGQVTRTIGGCPSEVSDTITKGEHALATGESARALALAEDGLVSAPQSACSNQFAAAAELMAMREQLAKGEMRYAEFYRRRCFFHAKRAQPLVGPSPRVDAIQKVCSAQ